MNFKFKPICYSNNKLTRFFEEKTLKTKTRMQIMQSSFTINLKCFYDKGAPTATAQSCPGSPCAGFNFAPACALGAVGILIGAVEISG